MCDPINTYDWPPHGVSGNYRHPSATALRDYSATKAWPDRRNNRVPVDWALQPRGAYYGQDQLKRI